MTGEYAVAQTVQRTVQDFWNTITRPEPWVQEALCAEVDADVFFPDRGESVAAAKAICARCDVARECLEYALRTNQTQGVYGGMSPTQRKRLRRKS